MLSILDSTQGFLDYTIGVSSGLLRKVKFGTVSLGSLRGANAPLFYFLPLSFQERGIKGVRSKNNPKKPFKNPLAMTPLWGIITDDDFPGLLSQVAPPDFS
jgi:hypothetical protein